MTQAHEEERGTLATAFDTLQNLATALRKIEQRADEMQWDKLILREAYCRNEQQKALLACPDPNLLRDLVVTTAELWQMLMESRRMVTIRYNPHLKLMQIAAARNEEGVVEVLNDPDFMFLLSNVVAHLRHSQQMYGPARSTPQDLATELAQAINGKQIMQLEDALKPVLTHMDAQEPEQKSQNPVRQLLALVKRQRWQLDTARRTLDAHGLPSTNKP